MVIVTRVVMETGEASNGTELAGTDCTTGRITVLLENAR
jgi:hypothetical protein